MLMAVFRYLVKWLSSMWEGYAKIEKRCISEPFEVQTKIMVVQTGTNDSLSSGINNFKKFRSWALTIF